MGIDDGRPDRRLREGEDEVEQERALARAGRPEDRQMTGEDIGPNRQRPAAALADDEARARTDERRRCGQWTGALEARPIERRVGQIPQLGQLPVRQPGGGGGGARAPMDLPANALAGLVEFIRALVVRY